MGVTQVFADCVAGVADPALRAKYASVAAVVQAAEANFDAQATAQALHSVGQGALVGGIITTAEMKGLYKGQMSTSNGGGRSYYDALKNAAPNKKCPLCGVGVVSTLDHHLPQSKYPDLTVSPLNLVPACADCNKAKQAKFPAVAAEQTIHPYFDDFTQVQWLRATLSAGPPLTVSYDTFLPATWGAVDGQRAARHFSVFKLAPLFAANANDELAVLKPMLLKLFNAAGAGSVQSYLAELMTAHSARLNSWQHALYITLANDAWFCGGGFGNIPDPQ